MLSRMGRMPAQQRHRTRPWTSIWGPRTAQRAPRKRAPEQDGITNEMLTHPSDADRHRLLDLVILSWRRGELPQTWANAIIIPVNKKGKPQEEDRIVAPDQAAELHLQASRAAEWSHLPHPKVARRTLPSPGRL